MLSSCAGSSLSSTKYILYTRFARHGPAANSWPDQAWCLGAIVLHDAEGQGHFWIHGIGDSGGNMAVWPHLKGAVLTVKCR